MDALRRWGASVDIGSRGVWLDMDAINDITASAAQCDTEGPGSGTLVDEEPGPEGGTGQLWAVATAVILGGAYMGVTMAQEDGPSYGSILMSGDPRVQDHSPCLGGGVGQGM